MSNDTKLLAEAYTNVNEQDQHGFMQDDHAYSTIWKDVISTITRTEFSNTGFKPGSREDELVKQLHAAATELLPHLGPPDGVKKPSATYQRH